MVLVGVDVPLGGQQVERGQLQVGERLHRPAILPVGGDEPDDLLLPAAEAALDRDEPVLLLTLEPPCGPLQGGDRPGQRGRAR
jgi:hypothetical protein